jgi:hypothetical protein
MSTETLVRGDVHNPADVERKIEETANRIAAGVRIVTDREKELKARKRDFDLAYANAYKNAEGSIKDREYTADIKTMGHREEADNAEIAYKHANRTADALEKELFAWQAILKSVVAMYGAVRA